jgi:AAA domain
VHRLDCSVIVWVNGAFGVGKTTVAAALVAALGSRARNWDPERVGAMLQSELADLPVEDFQDWSAWRQVVVATAAAIHEQTGQLLVVPQTVLEPGYLHELFGGLEVRGIRTFHVLLDASPETLHQRALDDPDQSARAWRLDHIDDYTRGRDWLMHEADLVVNANTSTAAQIANTIAEAVPDERD